MVEFIACTDLAEKLKSQKKPFLLDVRTQSEYDEAHIADSKLIPVQKLPEHLQKLPKNKHTEIVTYCQHGVRSQHAALFLQHHGYTHVKSMEGGLEVWMFKGLPVEK